jgi:nuclear transport factor 2 (NTF2) superfamily protein
MQWKRSYLYHHSHWKQQNKKYKWQKMPGIRQDPEKVSLAYTPDSEWRNRHLFINGREEIVQFLTQNGKMNWIIN